jgi:hypothetical protein
LHIDPWQLSHINVDNLDVAVAQWEEYLILDPRLDALAHFDRAAPEVEQRRKALGRECVERAAEPAGLGFEHRDLARSQKRATMPQSRVAAKGRRTPPL